MPAQTGFSHLTSLLTTTTIVEAFKKCYHEWYCEQIVQHLNNNDGDETTAANIDMKTSTIKPLHAQWLISTNLKMSTRIDLIKSGSHKAGL